MKILGLKSKLIIAKSEWTVTRISKTKVLVNNGKTSMDLPLDEVSREIFNKNWEVKQ